VEAVLFPANQGKAYNAFAAAISGYPPRQGYRQQ